MKTENTINTYGYCVIKSAAGFPLHIVEIYGGYHHGFFVFSTAAAARDYIAKDKEKTYNYCGIVLEYDTNFHFCKNLVKVYKEATAGLFTDIKTKQIYIDCKLATDFDYCKERAFYFATR